MIVLKKLAKDVLDNAMASGRVNRDSSPKAYLLQCTLHLGDAHKAADKTEERMPVYTEREFAAAEVVNWLLAYLEKIGCEDIEQLLKDAARYRRKHPDYHKGKMA